MHNEAFMSLNLSDAAKIFGAFIALAIAMSELWHRHSRAVRVKMLLLSIGCAAAIIDVSAEANHRATTDREQNATTRTLLQRTAAALDNEQAFRKKQELEERRIALLISSASQQQSLTSETLQKTTTLSQITERSATREDAVLAKSIGIARAVQKTQSASSSLLAQQTFLQLSTAEALRNAQRAATPIKDLSISFSAAVPLDIPQFASFYEKIKARLIADPRLSPTGFASSQGAFRSVFSEDQLFPKYDQGKLLYAYATGLHVTITLRADGRGAPSLIWKSSSAVVVHSFPTHIDEQHPLSLHVWAPPQRLTVENDQADLAETFSDGTIVSTRDLRGAYVDVVVSDPQTYLTNLSTSDNTVLQQAYNGTRLRSLDLRIGTHTVNIPISAFEGKTQDGYVYRFRFPDTETLNFPPTYWDQTRE